MSDQVATGALAVSVPEDEALRASVEALMRPPAPATVRQLRPPTVTGRVLLDLRTDGLSAWDAADEARQRVHAFWCRPGAELVLMVGAGLSPLPYLIDPILEREPLTIDVVGDDDHTTGRWVQALRGVAGGAG